MAVVGLGIDLCRIDRIERAIEKPHFVERAFTQGERAQIERRGAQTAAGYFAAKEAVAKALGTGFDGFFLSSVEIVNDGAGRPLCVLHGAALERMRALGAREVLVSITHEDGTAAAVAIVQ